MCGIAGLLETGRQGGRSRLDARARAMADAISHRGPDDSGVWQDPDVHLALAHRRLSIIDLSPEGHQPMASASGRYVISFNGEIYNFQNIRSELEQAGVTFRGRSDTEILLAAADRWGLNITLQKIGGMFAFALWDRQMKQLHLVRDRLGKKPLYMGWAGDTFAFGSELKALRAHPDFVPELNREALALYMRYSYVPAPHCIYKNVWSLPAGCRLCIDYARLQPVSDLSAQAEIYWNHGRVLEEARTRAQPMTDAQAVDSFEALLKDCVRTRMISDVPLGAFLSGGVDSSAVVALMQAQSGYPVKTYTIGFAETGFDEAAHARKIAAHLGTDHHELYLGGGEARDMIPDLARIYDEPFGDISALPTCLVAKFARRDVTVALSGDGGDEMLGGYERHIRAPAAQRKLSRLPLALRRWIAARITARPEKSWDRLAPGHPQFGARLYKLAGILPLADADEIYKRLLSHWDNPAALVTGGAEPQIPLLDGQWQARGLSFAERMMAGDALHYLPGDILVKVDRASMACALEARAPLLDTRVYEFVWGLPEKMKIRDGKGKWLLRQVLHRYVPEELFRRPKQGFSMPVGAWLSGPLRDWAEDLLDEGRMADDGMIDPAPVRKAWGEHLDGRGGHATRLWNVLMFQAWKRKWLDAAD